MNNADILGEEAAVRQIVEDDFSATDGVFEDDSVTKLKAYAFAKKTSLTSIKCPNLKEIGERAFFQNNGLKSVDFPNVTKITGQMPFYEANALTGRITLPELTTIQADYGFQRCRASAIILPKLTDINNHCFNTASAKLLDLGYISGTKSNTFISNSNLVAIVLRKAAIVTCTNTAAFNNTKYAVSGAGGAYVYVPRDLISSYQTATNWSTLYAAHSDMFRPLEDYTVDGTTIGAFDEALIATPTHPMYAVTNLDVSVDENHQRYITTTAEGHITYSSGAFTSENWSAVCIQSDEVGQTGSVSGNYFSIPAGSTVTMVIKNMTATQWNNVSGMRNQVSVRMRRSGNDVYNISWNEMKQAFYTDGLHRYEESYTNTGSSAITVVYIDLYGSLTPNNTLDFSLMVLLDGVRII